ncbi:hypothetical protein [Saccharopolyspora gloriosae]|uniref:hypothetical protein n=1 Tax=Saccharopolyspora gloriosae TaxID=455344 RepID=UPI001FB67874|nr:hypothetical protein [Saccharopolyspora gloriosae]
MSGTEGIEDGPVRSLSPMPLMLQQKIDLDHAELVTPAGPWRISATSAGKCNRIGLMQFVIAFSRKVKNRRRK